MVTTTAGNNNLAKIRWDCRRGMLELDKILTSFFDLHYANLPVTRQIQFTTLLGKSDATIYDWLVLGINLPREASMQDFILLIRYLSSKTILNELACGLG